ncbi:MAG: caspase family protein [Gammaproteobacteria bacterium]|nr:caspase family protein [Gammaproteobacteria bacterium]MBU1655375.1 caspase family protein [Gammaproteobacteria bacterium]MBU1960353.1 caspase family protein [Gammaproteobacteria bacterium]
MKSRILGLLVIVGCIGFTSVPFASPQPRIALVVGNAAYKDAPLRNPVNDANDFGARLRRLGFDVSLLLDADRRKLKEGIRDFSRKLNKDTVGLFYFAGHGIEVSGNNYLIPVNADIQGEADVEYEAINAGRLLSELKQANNGLNLVVLDACRNNPYARSFRSASRGLARMDAPAGTLILYATQPGDVAQDGQGRNGLFTEKLLKSLDTPGLKAEEVFKQTALDVNSASAGKQIPWQEGVILGHFYFNPASGQGGSTTVSPPPVQESAPPQYNVDVERLTELEVWNWAKEKDTTESYRQYLNQYPSGQFATMARLNIKEKQQPPPAPAPPVVPEQTTSIPENDVMAFIEQLLVRLNSGSADTLIAIYADQVDYFDRGFVSKSYILRDKAGYFKRWPSAQNRLIDRPSLYTTGIPGEVTATFTTEFNVYSPSTRKGVSGTANNTFKIRKMGGQWYVVAEKQNVLTRRKY